MIEYETPQEPKITYVSFHSSLRHRNPSQEPSCTNGLSWFLRILVNFPADVVLPFTTIRLFTFPEKTIFGTGGVIFSTSPFYVSTSEK